MHHDGTIQGEGGVMPLDKEFVQAVTKYAHEHDQLVLIYVRIIIPQIINHKYLYIIYVFLFDILQINLVIEL